MQNLKFFQCIENEFQLLLDLLDLTLENIILKQDENMNIKAIEINSDKKDISKLKEKFDALGAGDFSASDALLDLIKQSLLGIVIGGTLGYLAAFFISHEKFGFLAEFAPVVTLMAVIMSSVARSRSSWPASPPSSENGSPTAMEAWMLFSMPRPTSTMRALTMRSLAVRYLK